MNNRIASAGIRSVMLLLNILFIPDTSLSAQELQTPLQKSDYTRITSYEDLSVYLTQLDAASELLTVEVAGKSVQGRNLYAMKFSSSGFGKDPSKIRVLFFAQQHGNEPSGKEGALLLASELVKPVPV
jgi:murein tripeptide amidase MpaA